MCPREDAQAHTAEAGASAKGNLGNRQKIREIRIPDPFRFLGFYHMFIKLGLMGWIRTDSALLIAFYFLRVHLCLRFCIFRREHILNISIPMLK